MKFLPHVPFMNRWGYVFLILSAVMIIISLLEGKLDHPKAVKFEKGLFHTQTSFKIWSFLLTAIVAALYLVFW